MKYKHNLILNILLLVMFSISIFTSSCSSPVQAVDAVAKVNNTYILTATFERTLKDYKDHFINNYQVDFSTKDGQQLLHDIQIDILKRLIMEEIIVQTAQDFDIQVTDEEIKADLAEFNKIVNKDNVTQLFGENVRYDEEVLSENTRVLLYHRKLQNYLFKGDVTQEEIVKFYQENPSYFSNPETVRASHILVPTEEEAKKLWQQINLGADFAELAKKHSTCTSAPNGGDIGYFPRNITFEEFENVAFSLKIGEVSRPFNTIAGWHIVKLIDKKPPTAFSLEEYQQQIYDMLLQTKKDEVTNPYLNEKLQKATLNYYVDFGKEIKFE